MESTNFNQRPLPGPPAKNGCGFLIVVCLFSCVFLIINGMLVSGISVTVLNVSLAIAATTPRWLSGPRIAQIVVFALPVLMVFAEWALVDLIVDRISALDKPSSDEESRNG